MSTTPYILLAEDEAPIHTMVRYNLEKEGFEVAVAEDGREALEMLEDRLPDLVILDWMIPGVDGIEICQQLRRRSDTRSLPVIMLTARGEEQDRLEGLDSGADDYVIKPFSPKELIARVRAVLRRTRPVVVEKILEYQGLKADLSAYEVTFEGQPVHLGPTEFRLLVHLMEHPRQVFNRTQLLDAVWGQDVFIEERTVDVHIRRLRKALGHVAPELESMVQTVRSVGYKLE